MIKKVFQTLLLLLPVLLASSNTFVVEEITQDYLIVNFQLPNYEITPQTLKGEIFSEINCPDGTFDVNDAEFMLPHFTEIIGLPADGDFSYKIISQKKIEKEGINLSYSATLLLGENQKVNYDYKKNNQMYSKNETFPRQSVSRGDEAFMGDRKFRSIKIHPFQYNPSHKKLEIIQEMKIQINISGTKKDTFTGNQNFEDKVGEDFFLNNSYSKSWKKERVKDTNYVPLRSDEVTELQIIVDEEGLYKITYEYLADSLAAWHEKYEFESIFDWANVNPQYFELSDEYGAVPIYFAGERDGSFDAGDYFEFYGKIHEGEDGRFDDFTSENTYALRIGESIGTRLAVENGGLLITDTAQLVTPDRYQQTNYFEKQNDHNNFSRKQGFDFKEDLWMWRGIDAPNLAMVEFQLEYPVNINHFAAQAKVNLFGATHPALAGNSDNYAYDNDHHAVVRMNSALLGNKYWTGQSEAIFENNEIINTNFLHGSNSLYISLPGDTPHPTEKVLLDKFEVTYWREYKTDLDKINFSRQLDKPLGLYEFRIENFSTNEIDVYKLGSSKIENVSIEPFSESANSRYIVTFQDQVLSDDVEYFAVSEANKKSPVGFRVNFPKQIQNPNLNIDYAIITIQEFVEDEGTLLFKELWEDRGYNVEIFSTQDIYNEFNFGIRSVESIKDFIRYGYNNWNMTHVLLLGDGTKDERDHSPNRKYNLIPYKRIWTWKVGATASDTWLGCVVGDDAIPDLSIGRINVYEREQILPVAQKTESYLNEPKFNELWHSRITLTAGGKASDGNDIFAGQSERIKASFIPDDMLVERVYTQVINYSSSFNGRKRN